MKRKIFLSAALIVGLNASMLAQVNNDPVILKIANEPISKSEFERVFKKNNSKETTFDKKAVNEYLQLYINYKLKVKEALELGMDTAKSFNDELGGYRKQLAQPYLVDKQVSETLLREAYEHMKTDVRASHILVKCDQNALPSDTLAAYNKAMKIRTELSKGGDFAAVARRSSDDPSAKDNGGDLGFFSALQMVYPFENAAYNLKKDEMSMPVRTRFGYHIIKLTDSRPAQGEVKVEHIMIKAVAGIKGEDSVKAVAKINEIYAKLKAGDSFEDLAKQFSEDQSTAKTGGLLPSFGTGRMVPEFEKAAFALKYPGDYSMPVKTSYGWHILKLMETKPIGKYEDLQADLKQKVQKDSRSELSRTSLIARVRTKYNMKEMPKAKEEFMTTIDSTLSSGTWTVDKAAKLNNTMFTIGNKTYTQKDFATYVSEHQVKRESGIPAKVMANTFYNEWVNDATLAYEESKLDSLYPDFRNLMQEYRDGILLFELTDKKVWSKAVKDSIGLREFYDKHKNNYMWGDRVEATVYTCANEEVAAEVRKLMKKIDDDDTLMARVNKSSQLNLQVKSGKFSKGENDAVDKVNHKVGMSPNINLNNQVVFVNIKKLIPAAPKQLDEAKGLITADYQNQLEKEWIESLRAKYPVEIKQDVVDSIATK
ncbi:MAG: peptidylprolyl isomerase [Bacteroidetes bacterium]|nr:peptidylprolyl isomerase [Bacteroidota bacterium]